MRRGSTLRCALVLALAAAPLAAQAPDTTRADSLPLDSAAVPAPPAPTPLVPTPEQQQYLDGLKRVSRGISQLKIAVEQSTRAQTTADTATRRRAAGRLGSFCTSARSFISGGRARMQPMVFEDTTRVKARRLVQRLDEIVTYTKTCETQATSTLAVVTGEVAKRLQAYETALAEFRTAIGLTTNN